MHKHPNVLVLGSAYLLFLYVMLYGTWALDSYIAHHFLYESDDNSAGIGIHTSELVLVAAIWVMRIVLVVGSLVLSYFLARFVAVSVSKQRTNSEVRAKKL